MRVGVVTGEVAVTARRDRRGHGRRRRGQHRRAGAGHGRARARSGSTSSTRSLTAAAIDFVDAGAHALKGKAEPVALFRATAVIAARRRRRSGDGLEAPLVGRDRELRLLKELFHAAAEERAAPRARRVSGDAGVGKSRLAGSWRTTSTACRRRCCGIAAGASPTATASRSGR